MNMKTFFVRYANGKRHIVHSMLESVETFCNQHFGSAWDVAKEHGAHIHMTDHDPDANVADPKYDGHFGHGENHAPAPTQPPANPGGSPQPPAPEGSGDVVIGLSGTQADTATGGASA